MRKAILKRKSAEIASAAELFFLSPPFSIKNKGYSSSSKQANENGKDTSEAFPTMPTLKEAWSEENANRGEGPQSEFAKSLQQSNPVRNASGTNTQGPFSLRELDRLSKFSYFDSMGQRTEEMSRIYRSSSPPTRSKEAALRSREDRREKAAKEREVHWQHYVAQHASLLYSRPAPADGSPLNASAQLYGGSEFVPQSQFGRAVMEESKSATRGRRLWSTGAQL